MSTLHEIGSVAIKVATAGGDVLLKKWGVGMRTKHVTDLADIVSDADRESETAIVNLIHESFPSHGVYSEEGRRENNDAEFVWFIDPLDGSLNYLRNIPIFGVSIGVVQNGKPIMGVLHFPALRLTVWAEDGGGAYVGNKKIAVSKRPLAESLYYSGGKYKGEIQISSSISDMVGFVKVFDASSYALASISMGNAEVYYLNSVPHDVVAGVCVVREAGGMVTDGKGGEWSLESEKILATNGIIHTDIVNALKT